MEAITITLDSVEHEELAGFWHEIQDVIRVCYGVLKEVMRHSGLIPLLPSFRLGFLRLNAAKNYRGFFFPFGYAKKYFQCSSGKDVDRHNVFLQKPEQDRRVQLALCDVAPRQRYRFRHYLCVGFVSGSSVSACQYSPLLNSTRHSHVWPVAVSIRMIMSALCPAASTTFPCTS